uniref:Uncharacterized protein n=1 Tax=Romanomermis culicivorax TaxID=13658 RepID=A0A915KFS0_ROMCU
MFCIAYLRLRRKNQVKKSYSRFQDSTHEKRRRNRSNVYNQGVRRIWAASPNPFASSESE